MCNSYFFSKLESFKKANDDNISALNREREVALRELESRLNSSYSENLETQLQRQKSNFNMQLSSLEAAQNNITQQLSDSEHLIQQLKNRPPQGRCE